MIINYFDKNSTKIILFLVLSPGNNYRRNEIKNKIKMNNVLLDNSLNKLLNLKLIVRKGQLYSLNIGNGVVKDIISEIKEKISNLPLDVQFILQDFLKEAILLRYFKNLILFGSYSKLIFSEKSDVDLAVVFPDNLQKKKKFEKKLFFIGRKLSKKYKREIQIHFFSESDLRHKDDLMIKDILRNGINLLE